MTRTAPWIACSLVLVLSACASTGAVPFGDGTYKIVKKSAAPGLGVSVSTKLAVEREAREFCQGKGQALNIIEENVVGAEPGQLGFTELRFTCGTPVAQQVAAAAEQCRVALSTPQLDPIRAKVELQPNVGDAAVPFQIASNDTFPTTEERPVISRWATIRDECNARSFSVPVVPAGATALRATAIQRSNQFYREAAAQSGQLIVALYNQKLTYGEFAQKRYEIGRDALTADLAFRESVLEKNEQRALQAQQIAEQQYSNRLAAMANYLQAVEARKPLDVHVSGSISVFH